MTTKKQMRWTIKQARTTATAPTATTATTATTTATATATATAKVNTRGFSAAVLTTKLGATSVEMTDL
jgi:hypothetical protein